MLNIQATGKLYDKVITIKQISKRTAKKLFESGNEIYLQSCKMYPFGVWQNVCPIKKDIDYTNQFNATSFESVVNNFEYYNCDSERGKYSHFYKAI